MTGQFSQQTTGTSRGHAGRRAWVRKEEGTLVIVSYHTLVKLGGFMVLFSTLCFEQFQTYRKVERLVQQSFIIHISLSRVPSIGPGTKQMFSKVLLK